MAPGQHASDDGSFGRSAGAAGARAIALIVVAVLLGVVLLNATNDPEPFAAATTEDDDDDRGTTPVVDDEGDDTTSTSVASAHNPAEVTILVANGSTVKGAAGRVAETLKGSNYVTAEPTNTKTPAEASMVYFMPGYEADANAIAALLGPTPPVVQPLPDPPPVEDLAGAHVLVVVAADLAGR